jgi:hypothetical protein
VSGKAGEAHLKLARATNESTLPEQILGELRELHSKLDAALAARQRRVFTAADAALLVAIHQAVGPRTFSSWGLSDHVQLESAWALRQASLGCRVDAVQLSCLYFAKSDGCRAARAVLRARRRPQDAVAILSAQRAMTCMAMLSICSVDILMLGAIRIPSAIPAMPWHYGKIVAFGALIVTSP